MLGIIEWTWFVCLLIISLYHLIVFRFRIPSTHKPEFELPGVSIIIAVRNGTSILKEHLAEIVYQDYPQFEVILVDDRSDPAERKNLEGFISIWPGVKLLTSNAPGKKQALKTGAEHAIYDFILFTDADCKPASKDWMKIMMEYKHAHLPIVIGYSPYQKLPGILNLLIRFETVMTGLQYISWTMKGKPYMAVGRNILYSRSLFLSTNPFSLHQHIPYGDDDLGLQALTGRTLISVCSEKKAHVVSRPATSWKEWLRQKHRHLSAGHYYKPELWWQPGLFGIALAGHWFLLPFLFIEIAWWSWIPIFVVSLLFRWMNYFDWTTKLGDKDTVRWFPCLEIIYTIYLFVMGVVTIVAKKKSWN